MKPRLLLVEDDSISGLFMAAALEAIPAQVDVAGSMAGALAIEAEHQLWLLDANLPDGRGADLLDRLRSRHPGTPAFAHTADDSPALHAELRAAGFDQVLLKPLSAAGLRSAVCNRLGLEATTAATPHGVAAAFDTLPLWDPAAALAALNGNQEHVATLRGMFLDELDRQHDEILVALRSGDREQAKRTLHQLKASSGFVGAMRLNATASALERSLGDRRLVESFSSCVIATRS